MEKRQPEERGFEELTSNRPGAADEGGQEHGLDPQRPASAPPPPPRQRTHDGAHDEPASQTALTLRGGATTAALSFAQQRLLIIHQLSPDSPAYNMPAAVHIRGALDIAALERSLGEIVRRHESLRTTFRRIDGKPAQVIAKSFDLSLPVLDLTHLSDAQREAQVRQLRDAEALQPFDLSRGPLLRVKLLKLGAEEFALLLTMHHIVSDGWSVSVFVQEMATLYDAFANGRPSPLPELRIQYADYAVWQREWLQGERLEEQLSYWKGHLAGAPPLLELPTDKPRPAVQGFHGARQTLEFGTALSLRLKELSRREKVTLFMILLAALEVLLYRYTGQEDISVGTSVANRNRAEIEPLIGFFVNTLVLRTRMSVDWSFRRLISEVRKTAVGAYAHQDLPFEKLVEELSPERDRGHSPLFQVMFVLQNTPKSELRLGNLTLSPMGGDGATSKFDLAWSVSEAERGLSVAVEYSTDIFEAETIERMLRHFRNVLEAVAADPGQSLYDIPVISKAERQHLLFELNRAGADSKPATPPHQLLLAQVSRSPAAVALLTAQAAVSYEQLNKRAERLALHLRGLGVAPEARVGVLVSRSAEMVAGLLAVIKAGGACVVIEPDAPAADLADVLRGVAVLLTEQALAGRVPHVEIPLLEVDGRGERTAASDRAAATEGGTGGQSLACVSYVSESQGQTNGVMLTYGALANRVGWLRTAFPLDADDVVLLAPPRGLAASAWDFFWPLLCGARLVPDAPEHKAADLLRLISERRVTVLHLTPSMLRALLSEPEVAASCQSLRLVLCSGGALPLELREKFQSLLRAELCNLYGTAETAGAATFWSGGGTGSTHNAPLGRPVTNSEVYLLDSRLEPAPLGAPGELYVAGAGLARGYLGRADLTAERFIPHPFSQEPGARLYKTGEVARYLPDGSVELLRPSERWREVSLPEPEGEAEAALKEHPAVREAVVVTREDEQGEKHTVAYLVCTAGAAPTPAECYDFLKDVLAEEKMPAAFVTLESLPLKGDGTVDLQALSAPTPEAFATHESHLAPRDLIELELAQLWEEVLDVRPVDIKTNFFTLGGNSLSALTLMIEVQDRFNQELPPDLLFQGVTVESMANLLRQGRQSGPQSPLVPLQPKGSNAPFFCVHAIGGNVFPYLELARTLGPEQPFYGLQARGLTGDEEPCRSIEEMAGYYIEALTAVQPSGPYQLGGWSFGGVVAFEMARQLEAAGRQVSLLVLLDSRPPAAAGAEHSVQEDNEAVLLANFLLDMGMMNGRTMRASFDEISHLAPDEQLSYVWGRAQASGLIPSYVSREQLEHLLRIFRSNHQAFMNYSPEPHAGRLVLFRAGKAEGAPAPDDTLGWERLTTQGVEVHQVPGTHYTMLNRPHVQVLAELLAGQLSNPGREATTRPV